MRLHDGAESNNICPKFCYFIAQIITEFDLRYFTCTLKGNYYSSSGMNPLMLVDQTFGVELEVIVHITV